MLYGRGRERERKETSHIELAVTTVEGKMYLFFSLSFFPLLPYVADVVA